MSTFAPLPGLSAAAVEAGRLGGIARQRERDRLFVQAELDRRAEAQQAQLQAQLEQSRLDQESRLAQQGMKIQQARLTGSPTVGGGRQVYNPRFAAQIQAQQQAQAAETTRLATPMAKATKTYAEQLIQSGAVPEEQADAFRTFAGTATDITDVQRYAQQISRGEQALRYGGLPLEEYGARKALDVEASGVRTQQQYALRLREKLIDAGIDPDVGPTPGSAGRATKLQTWAFGKREVPISQEDQALWAEYLRVGGGGAPVSPQVAPAAGSGRQVTADIARRLLEQAGGDKEEARRLAREQGYSF